MKRAAIYARFSSALQNENSCNDQIALCTAWAETQGFAVAQTFQDDAVSGASTAGRFGLARMLRSAQDGEFDVVICEALDRLSRDQGDLAQMRKRLAFHDVGIFTVQDGEVGTIHVGIKGLMGELYLADLAQKTRRGLRAVAQDGRHPGGRSYGYDLVSGLPGELTINPNEAEVIRRIFAAYIAGQTPRQIVTALNADGIPGPRGGKWNASTLNGSRERQNGILMNRLYVGQQVWNRQRFVKDPDTGKRTSRLNPQSEWLIRDVPHLSIIDRATFDTAQAIKARKGGQMAHRARQPRHLLSGLTVCGVCGGGYIIQGADRMGCSAHRERGTCSNNRTVTRMHIEARVLAALQDQLASPDLVAEYVQTYHAERTRLASAARKGLNSASRQRDEVTRSINRLVDHIAAGTDSPAMVGKLKDLEAERKRLDRQINTATTSADPVTLHPGAAEKYRRIAANLHAHLASMTPDDNRDALLNDLRGLIEKVTITPTGPRKPVLIDVQGLLANLLTISKPADQECRGLLVAGARTRQCPKFAFSA